MSSIGYSCHILIKFKIFWADFRKIFQYQISWTSVQREPSCSIWTKGQTGRHDDR